MSLKKKQFSRLINKIPALSSYRKYKRLDDSYLWTFSKMQEKLSTDLGRNCIYDLRFVQSKTFMHLHCTHSCSVASSSPALWDPMDYRPPGSSSMGFSRQEYWSGLPFPSPRDLPHQGSNPSLLHWQADSLPLSHLGSPIDLHWNTVNE